MAKTYAELMKEVVSLQAQADAARTQEIEGVVSRIKEAIATYGLTLRDLGFSGKAAKQTKRSKTSKASNSKAADLTVKYKNADGGTWVGRGPRPLWLRAAIAEGHSLEEFSVTRANLHVVKTIAGAKPLVRLGKKNKASKVLYGDGTGKTWGGHGRKPFWVNDALAAGKTLSDLVVNGASKAEATKKATSASKKPVKRRPTRVLFRDAGGNTWTGRGPRPAWLRTALASGKTEAELRAA